jgi:hypothetical protein
VSYEFWRQRMGSPELPATLRVNLDPVEVVGVTLQDFSVWRSAIRSMSRSHCAGRTSFGASSSTCRDGPAPPRLDD